MLRKIYLIIGAFFLLSSFIIAGFAFAQTEMAVAALCELGVSFYNQGRYDDALLEFKKALMIDPKNETAKNYVNNIFKQESPAPVLKDKTLPQQQISEKPKEEPKREEIINKTLTDLSKKEPLRKVRKKEPVDLSGEFRLSLGATPHDVIWKDANANEGGVPREKNWRYLWGDKRENTYDAKIYDRLELAMETKFNSPLNAFMDITLDPWSVIGKKRVTVSSGSDAVDMQLKYWSADNRTIEETYRSQQGRVIRLKQIKVKNSSGKTTLSGLTIAPNDDPFGSIDPLALGREYRPFRKFWLDYKGDDYALKIFPLSDEFEALTSDDPLRLSNNHVYWEESPWLDTYEPSRIFIPFAGAGSSFLKQGRWIRTLSYFSRDSDQRRLIFLRGASFKLDPGIYSLEATLATPMSLWDEYSRANSVDGALRLKVPFGQDLQLGLTSTSKVGLHGGKVEAYNQVQALDLNYALSDYDTLYAEVGGSHTHIKEAEEEGFDTNYDAAAAKLGFSYNAGKEKQNGFYKSGIYFGHMDGKFYPALSDYRYTRRDDPTFSRHVYFSRIKPEDAALIWGDGIDRGRNVLGFNLGMKFFEEKLDTDIKYRNVHKDSGKYIESVLRTESTYKANPKLTSKLLGYYQHLHRTYANYDPVLYAKTMYSLTDYFSEEDIHPENDQVIDDKDPSIGAFGLGTKYDFNDQLSLEGVYEFTNDPLDFPRALLNELRDPRFTNETRDGVVWDKVVPFVYDQRFFDLPPYSYYNIAKTKFIYTPFPRLEFILSYTFNENKHAAGIDDNINHAGLETTYRPTDKWTFWLKYIYSRLIDVYKQNKFQSSEYYDKHYNVFFGSEYRFNKDETFTLLYGEFVGYDDPYQQAIWTLSALDTQHIFRLFYKRKF